jgi:hypothetical protein
MRAATAHAASTTNCKSERQRVTRPFANITATRVSAWATLYATLYDFVRNPPKRCHEYTLHYLKLEILGEGQTADRAASRCADSS